MENEEFQNNNADVTETEEETEELPFAKADVVRLMKQHLDSAKMIR